MGQTISIRRYIIIRQLSKLSLGVSEIAIIDVWTSSMSLNMFAHGSLISKIILVNFISIFLIIVFLFILLILIIDLFYFLFCSAKIRLKVLSSIEHQFFLTVCIGAPFELTFTILLKPFAKHSFVVGRLNTRGNLGFVGLCRAC